MVIVLCAPAPLTYAQARELARLGLRRCIVCHETQPVGQFIGSGRKCASCRNPPKVCGLCGESKPSGEFVPGGRNCSACRAVPYSQRRPRACVRCFEVKSADAFPWGDGRKGRGCFRRRRAVCLECVAREEAERAQRAAEKQTTFLDPETGRMMRRCRPCGQVKDLERDFYVGRRDKATGEVLRYDSRCKACQVERVTQRAKERLRDPETAESERARRRRWQALWRERNYEYYRELQRAYERRVRADPVRHAARREAERMAYRLRREREGVPLDQQRRVRPRVVASEVVPRLPALPLAGVLDDLIDSSPENQDWSVAAEAVCAQVGVDSGQLRAWRRGHIRTVQFSTADRVLTMVGLPWWVVWPEDAYPEVHAALA